MFLNTFRRSELSGKVTYVIHGGGCSVLYPGKPSSKLRFWNSSSSLFYLFIFVLNFYLTIVDLQYCVNSGIQLQILFHYRLLQDTEYISQCYTVNPCCLFYIQWYVSVNPKLLTCSVPRSPLVTISLFSMSVSLFLFCK